MTSQEIRISLLAVDPEFKRLAEQHSRCESQLEEILSSSYVSGEDLIQEITLKKLKLHLKDQMESIIAHYQRPYSH
jgi:uncharacterized protein YdcH (DUF465 family)